MSWEMTIIGDHCTVTSSKRFHLSERSNSGVPFYCSKEIIQKNRGEEITDCDYISEELYLNIAEKFGVPQENDLLVTTRGTIGIPYLYRRNDRFYFADGNLTWIKDFKETLLPHFLYYWFRTHEGQKKIDAIAKGTAQKAVPIAGIKTLEISLPPVDVQRQIADILTTYDSLIENNRKQIKLLEEAAQRLYKEWFVDLRFPGHETTPVVDGLPDGWHNAVVTDLLEINYGKDHKALEDGPIPVYGSGGLMRKVNKILHSGECVLIPRKGSLNNIILVNGDFWTIDTMFFGVPRQPNVAKYVYLFLLGVDMYAMNIGAAVPSMTVKILDGMKILCPAPEILEQFENMVRPFFSMIEMLKKKSKFLADARDLLLPKLMNGEIEV